MQTVYSMAKTSLPVTLSVNEAEMSSKSQNPKHPTGQRHETNCKVCAHPQRGQIEDEFCSWANISKLAKSYGLSRDSIYRHAAAYDLREKRGRNLRAALERIIERAEDVSINAAAVVSAVTAYAKINSQGAWVDRVERIDLNTLFEKMTGTELEAYARDGILPRWFTQIVGATQADSQEKKTNG